MKQEYIVLQHLKSEGSITGTIAHKQNEIYRLSSVINRLRKKGVAIETIRHRYVDDKGNHREYGEYRLEKNA